MPRATWFIQQIIPPALLSYFFWAWKTCVTEIGPRYIGVQLGYPVLGWGYTILATVLISSATVLFLRLYFLPSSQSVPPSQLPPAISRREVIFECLSPEEAAAILDAEGSSSDSTERGPIDPPAPETETENGEHAGKVGAMAVGSLRARGIARSAVPAVPASTIIARFLPWTLPQIAPPPSSYPTGDNSHLFHLLHHSHVSQQAELIPHPCQFANCLTTPHIPTFILLLILTPLSVFLLSLPVYRPMASRALEAFRLSRTDEEVKKWYDWWPSWMIAGGPVGRYVGGMVLGWKALDRRDGGGGYFRVQIGVLVGIGSLLAMITLALAITSIKLILDSHLTIDRERSRAHARTLHAISLLEASNRPIPPGLSRDLERFSSTHYFFVPFPDPSSHAASASPASPASPVSSAAPVTPPPRIRGIILPTLPNERVYDIGTRRNWEQVMGKGWGWVLPWNALRRGMTLDEILNWPIAPEVAHRLRDEARRRIEVHDDDTA